ncbi:MAG: FHA domain-containing protein [Deltaproteobacteria bacterium]|nr:FHA domain-containing protein [Deltaproteobacteria bacterium]
MKPVLHIISGVAATRSFDLRQGDQTIGRENSADIQIPSKEISRHHARITIQGEKVAIIDLQSSNGTIVNTKRVNSKALKHKDRIILGDVILEFRDEEKYIAQKFDGGKTLYQQATKVMTERLKPRNLWPYFFMFFGFSFVLVSWLMHSSYKSLLHDRLTQSYIQNAQNITRYLAEKNREDLKLHNHLLLDVSVVENEPGVIDAMVISNKGRILAPAKNADKTDQGPYVMEALSHDSNTLILPSPRNSKGHQVFVHPIRVYDDRQGKYVTLGVAKIIFSADKAIGDLPETDQMLYLMLLLSLLISMGLSWIVSKSLSIPITQLAEKVQRWRTGQAYQNQSAPFKDWDPLYQAIERAIEEADK